MLDRIKQIPAGPIFQDDEDKTRTAGLLNIILLACLTVGAIFVPVSVFVFRSPIALAIFLVTILMSLVALALMRRGRVRTVGALLSSLAWLAVTFLAFAAGGVASPYVAIYISVILFAGLTLGGRMALVFAGLSSLAGLLMLFAETSGRLTQTPLPITPLGTWAIMSANMIVAGLMLHLAARGTDEALARARRNAAELDGQRKKLKEIVRVRADQLARRDCHLLATAEVARHASSVPDWREFLSRAVDAISNQLGYYHTAVFLLDDSGEWAELQASSSDGGKRMLARSHRLQVGEDGIVGHVIRLGSHRVASEMGADAEYLINPDLPDTRSEIALPLRAGGGRIMGALDVQSTEPDAFSEGDVTILQALADLLALAISNAHHLQQANNAAEAERRAYGQLTHEAWLELLRSQTDLAVLKAKDGNSSAPHERQPEVDEALQKGKTVSAQNGSRAVATPIKVGDQVIGVIDAQKPDDADNWTPEQVSFLETLADELGLALENARSFQDSQQRAFQEQLVSEIIGRMRRSLDVETVLKTAAQEIRQVLDLPEVTVRLAPRVSRRSDNGNRRDGQ